MDRVATPVCSLPILAWKDIRVCVSEGDRGESAVWSFLRGGDSTLKWGLIARCLKFELKFFTEQISIVMTT
jgi:hypothetical protein